MIVDAVDMYTYSVGSGVGTGFGTGVGVGDGVGIGIGVGVINAILLSIFRNLALSCVYPVPSVPFSSCVSVLKGIVTASTRPKIKLTAINNGDNITT